MDAETQAQMITMLIADNRALREAGGKLVEAATHVVVQYDGCHRLALACADFMKVLADEGGRAVRHGK